MEAFMLETERDSSLVFGATSIIRCGGMRLIGYIAENLLHPTLTKEAPAFILFRGFRREAFFACFAVVWHPTSGCQKHFAFKAVGNGVQ
jgi:hypothetical protein